MARRLHKDNTDMKKTYEKIRADLKLVLVDETFPRYVRDHLEEFYEKGYFDRDLH